MSDYRELLLGCGHSRKKVVVPPGAPTEWQNLTTLDANEVCKPDIIWNLEDLPWPLDRAAYDEIHAYEVLEHLGRQGDAFTFFAHFWQIWRALKPGGFLCGTTPSRYSSWLWGDPGHTRVIIRESLTFLDQTHYIVQQGITTLSDYRSLFSGDFTVLKSEDDRTFHTFVLQAVKPSRTTACLHHSLVE